MADGQDKAARRLTLSRETLRNLEPTAQQAATVKGGMGQSSICGGPPPCQTPGYGALTQVLGATHMSWGCVGSIEITHEEGRTTFQFDLHPNEETLRFAERGLDAPPTSE